MQSLFTPQDMPNDIEDLLGPRVGMRLIEVTSRIYNGQNNDVNGAGMRMLANGNVYPNPFDVPYGVYPGDEDALRHAARLDQDQWERQREVLLRPLERTPDGYYVCRPILSMYAVLSRFSDDLRNLNQRRENDANRQRQSRARKKKAGDKTGHVTKARRKTDGGDPGTTPAGGENQNQSGNVTGGGAPQAGMGADGHATNPLNCHVMPSSARHVTPLGRARDYIENPPVFSMLSPTAVNVCLPGSAVVTLRQPEAVACATSRRSSNNYNKDNQRDSSSVLTTTPSGTPRGTTSNNEEKHFLQNTGSQDITAPLHTATPTTTDESEILDMDILFGLGATTTEDDCDQIAEGSPTSKEPDWFADRPELDETFWDMIGAEPASPEAASSQITQPESAPTRASPALDETTTASLTTNDSRDPAITMEPSTTAAETRLNKKTRKAVSAAVGALQDAVEDVPLLYCAQRGSATPFAILPALFRRHQENYSEMDVLSEMRGLASWSEDNGAKRKKNTMIFFTNCLSRKNERGQYKPYRRYVTDTEASADLCPQGMDPDLWTRYVRVRLYLAGRDILPFDLGVARIASAFFSQYPAETASEAIRQTVAKYADKLASAPVVSSPVTPVTDNKNLAANSSPASLLDTAIAACGRVAWATQWGNYMRHRHSSGAFTEAFYQTALTRIHDWLDKGFDVGKILEDNTLSAWKSLINTSEQKNNFGPAAVQAGYQPADVNPVDNQRATASIQILRDTLAAEGIDADSIRKVVNAHLTTCDEFLKENYPTVYYRAIDSGQLKSACVNR
ncbi:hypothetical protein HAP94_10875 [Acidithiobacillus ferrivorans]|nr:hypothetical protein [Acidithiobacillus ferrivorans]